MAKQQRIFSKSDGGNRRPKRAAYGAPIAFIRDFAIPGGLDGCIEWPFAVAGTRYNSGGGYGVFWHDGKQSAVHRFVCLSVHGEPPSEDHQAAHECGNSRCVNSAHLSWKTPHENCLDKITHGTQPRGERNHFAKLTECQVTEIMSMKGSLTQTEIAALYGISQTTVQLIHSGGSWAWLTGSNA